MGGNLFFRADDDGTSGRELWVTDGTLAGTTLVLDILPGFGGSSPINFTVVGDTLFFSATGPSGKELYKLTVPVIVPEPSTILILGGALALCRRRKEENLM